jgi:predicted nuclease of predicted toxin-antitoxin system
MRLVADQDVYAATVRVLRDVGHDVASVAEPLPAQAADEDVLRCAHQHQRVLVTRDSDFGALVFLRTMPAGVIYLRLGPPTLAIVHIQLLHVLATHTETELRTAFTVIEAGLYRLRRSAPAS